MPSLVRSDEGTTELSIYSGSITPENAAKQVAKVKASFPQLRPEFFTMLIKMMQESGFSDERLIDSVNHVIKTCIYPTPTMANFLTFDKRVKLYTYNEVVTKVAKRECSFNDFALVTIDNQVFRVTKSDKILYNLPDEF